MGVRSRAGFVPSRTLALVLALVFAVAACGGTAPLSDEVVSSFDISGERLAIIGDTQSESVSTDSLLRSIVAARDAGTELRVVIAGDDVELVDPKSVTDRYGGTVLSYRTGEANFRAASRDIADDQLIRARDAAQVADIGGSVMAFVGLLETEGGVMPKQNLGATQWLLRIGVAACLLLFLWQLNRFRVARARSRRRQQVFTERQQALREWVLTLRPEVGRVEPFSTRLDASQLRQLEESRDLLDTVGTSIDEAVATGELDAAEMRISRVAIKLRDLRRAIDV